MIRVIAYFVLVGALAAAAAWFADHPGDVLIRWFDIEAETSVGVLTIGMALLGLLIYGLAQLLRFVTRGPRAIAASRAASRKAKRLNAVIRGFAAASIGDGEAARRALAFAEGEDEHKGLARLLAAQVAEIDRDEAAVESAYRELLKDPDTEFLGLRGLYESALRQGDKAAALEFATRAYDARPRSPWVAEQLFRVQTQSGAWELAKKTITSARRAGALTAEAARRREGVLIAAEALSADATGAKDRAFTLAQKSLGLVPGLVPMAVMVARGQVGAGQLWAAQGTIEAAWRAHPHPDLARAYGDIKPNETREQRSHRLMGLAEFNPTHVESRLLVASEALVLGDVRRARRALKPALDAPSARVLMLMSDIALKAGDGEGEAQIFRARAVMAPRDAQWECRECGRDRPGWTPVCDACGAFDSLAWGSEGRVAGVELLPGPKDELDWHDEVDVGEAEAELPALTPASPPAPAQRAPPALVVEAAAAAPAAATAPAADTEVFAPPRQPDDPGIDETKERRRLS